MSLLSWKTTVVKMKKEHYQGIDRKIWCRSSVMGQKNINVVLLVYYEDDDEPFEYYRSAGIWTNSKSWHWYKVLK